MLVGIVGVARDDSVGEQIEVGKAFADQSDVFEEGKFVFKTAYFGVVLDYRGCQQSSPCQHEQEHCDGQLSVGPQLPLVVDLHICVFFLWFKLAVTVMIEFASVWLHFISNRFLGVFGILVDDSCQGLRWKDFEEARFAL